VRITSRLVCGLAAVLFLTVTASAEYYVVPRDVELIADAEVIAIVRVKEIASVLVGERRIVTNIDVEPEDVLKGDIDRNELLRIVEPGGRVDGKIMMVSASPHYWIDNRALVFLTREEEGWRTWGAALGKFDFVIDTAGRELAVRFATAEDAASLWSPDGKPHEERLRDSRLFIEYIRTFVLENRQPKVPDRLTADSADTAHAADPAPNYFVEPAPGKLSTPSGWDAVVALGATAFPPSAYTQGPFRWLAFETGSVTFRSNGDQPGYDEVGAAQRALAAWTNDPGSNVVYLYGGTTDAGFEEDGENTIAYNRSTGVPAGAIAFAQWFGGEEHQYKGEMFFSIFEGDVIVRSNLSVSAKVFDEAITHELGHTLGFRHSDTGTPASDAAVMRSSLTGNFGATLGPWDIDAVRTVYDPSVKAVRFAPSNLVARATSTTTVLVTWNVPLDAVAYQVERSVNDGAFTRIATVTDNSYTDTGRTPNTTYVYRVRAIRENDSVTGYSNRDHATTLLFTDDPLAPGDPIKAVHLTELRVAVNAVRAAAGLAAATWTDPNPLGAPVKAVHITELRAALAPALTELGKTAAFSDGVAPGNLVRAAHFQEIRELVK
jgi:Dual-action HEIGH metallo-peptidase